MPLNRKTCTVLPEYKIEGIAIATGSEYLLMKNDHEIESVECVDFGTILDMVTNGEIYVGLHVAIIMRFFLQDEAEALVSRTDHTREPSSHTATRGL